MSNEKPAVTKKQTAVQALKFVAFSCTAGAIQILSFTLLNELYAWPNWKYEYGPSYFIALTLSVVYNFTINRKFTFKSVANVPIAMLKIIAYYAVFTPLSIWWGDYFTKVRGVNEYIVLLLTMLLNMLTEFMVYRIFVYRNTMYTSKDGIKELEKLASKDVTQANEES